MAAPPSRPTGQQRPIQRMGSNTSMRRRLGGSEIEQQPRVVGEHYQLGAEIGRGGFGVVFSALDLRSARSVAIKQVSLADMDADALRAIESEVSLLRKLSHANIVTYVDTIRTPAHLHIVLEYMENGSLAQFMKKFGAFAEPLVAMYVAQVLRGLAYLHEQGVLHRDVKGANILTTKDGLVKLADFGVAVKLSDTNESKSHSVVGSPYWMAPEVIEMSGWSFAADIWSVGCTVIELLTTKPPYFDLAPMAALFRIVQDDHPPLPERISPVLQDFMRKCFMKEPRLRSSASELLLHPWIAQIPRNKVDQVARSVSSSHARDAVLNTIQLYKDTQKKEKEKEEEKGEKEEEDGEEEEENWDDEFGVAVDRTPLTLQTSTDTTANATTTEPPVADLVSSRRGAAVASSFQLSKEDATALLDDELWGDDADEVDHGNGDGRDGQSGRSMATAKPAKSADDEDERLWSGSALIPMEKRLSKLRAFREDDDDDGELQFLDVDEDKLVQAVAAAAAGRRQLKRSASSLGPTASFIEVETATALDRFREDDDALFSDEGDDDDDELHWDATYDRRRKSDLPLALQHQPHHHLHSAESSSDVLFDDEELDFEYSSVRETHQKATARVLDLLALLDPSLDDQVILDACTSLQELLETHTALRRDLMSQPGVIPNIMEALEMKKLAVLCAVLRVVNTIVQDNQRFQENLALVGLVPVVIRLTKRHATSVTGFHTDRPKQDEHGEEEDHLYDDQLSAESVRLEAAKFVRQSCQTSLLTLQMFVACGGLPVLVDFLTVDAARALNDQKQLLRIALEGIFSVFKLQTIPKNDICRLFVKAGLLRKFITVFHAIIRQCCGDEDDDEVSETDEDDRDAQEQDDRAAHDAHDQSTLRRRPWSLQELDQMCDVLLVFSQGDAVVKEHMCDGAVLEGVRHALTAFTQQPQDHQELHDHRELRQPPNGEMGTQVVLKLLKCLRNLSMEPLTLDKLDRAGTIATLVELLTQQCLTASTKRREMENLVLQTMFYLCRLDRHRQTRAAQAGVVPSLLEVVRSGSPLRQFALPLLCDFAHASPLSRAQLWAAGSGSSDGSSVAMFLDLLDDKYWQVDAIKSLSVWLVHDTVKMEHALLDCDATHDDDPVRLLQLLRFFRDAHDTELETLLEPLLDMLTRSVRLNQTLGRSALFVREILAKLRRVPKALVRKNLLKMLKCLFESHTCPQRFVVEFELFPVVFALAQDANSMILVKEIASQLLQAILVVSGVC